jgi:uncharacterized membrane protein (UPF0127 family)
MATPVIVKNLTRPLGAPARAGFCDSFRCRLRGLMFRRRLGPEEGLLLVEARDSRLDTAIHMLFVSFDLAVFWINSEMTVVDKVLARSWHPAYAPRTAARYTLELHAGRFGDYELGDQVEFSHE